MDMTQEIQRYKEKLQDSVYIVGHHYMADSVIRHVDKAGDSLELSRLMDKVGGRHVVFCGVHFMAESACVMAMPGQQVYLPAPDAQCVMAGMCPAPLLEHVLNTLQKGGRKVIPLAYVNTPLAVKAVVGKFGGAVCTSSSATKMLTWALAEGDAVLFLPDKNLGQNTAKLLGLPQNKIARLHVQQNGALIKNSQTEAARLLLWPGCCAVHAKLTPEHAKTWYAAHPGGKIFVHPECAPALVDMVDGAGSTTFLIQQAENAPAGAQLAIGTEINLVDRLAKKHAGRVHITSLSPVACSNMAKLQEKDLLVSLKELAGEKVPHSTRVHVDPALIPPARAAIEKMLTICA